MHKHHIIPKHEGGSDFAENIVELTVTQHAMWHFAEWQRKGKWQDKLAWQGLAKIISHEEAVREAISKSHKERTYPTGWKHSEETKEKISTSQIGKSIPSETRAKMSTSAKKRCTPEWRDNLSKKLRGRTPPNKGTRMSEEQKAKISAAAKRRANKR